MRSTKAEQLDGRKNVRKPQNTTTRPSVCCRQQQKSSRGSVYYRSDENGKRLTKCYEKLTLIKNLRNSTEGPGFDIF